MIKDIFVFILACIIGTSCSNKTKRVNTNFNETHANKDIKPSKMSFASLGTFSNNVESALIPCYDLNIDKYIQKSKEILTGWKLWNIHLIYLPVKMVVISYYLRQRMPQD